jgi:hypothetical protein
MKLQQLSYTAPLGISVGPSNALCRFRYFNGLGLRWRFPELKAVRSHRSGRARFPESATTAPSREGHAGATAPDLIG